MHDGVQGLDRRYLPGLAVLHFLVGSLRASRCIISANRHVLATSNWPNPVEQMFLKPEYWN